MSEDTQKPVVRILHHMARSGGTIISKCLGCMGGVILLSEIHPFGYKKQYFNPLWQAHHWFGLLRPMDLNKIKVGSPLGFQDAINMICERCMERNLTLVIRDWSHIDFTGWPHNMNPSYKLSTAYALSPYCKIINAATVRHPIDQWISFRESQSWVGKEYPIERYLFGYRKFAEVASRIGYVKYEDFVENPSHALKKICTMLHVSFDPEYTINWRNYKSITTAPGPRDSGSTIFKRPRRELSEELLGSFLNNKDYYISINLLGYDHPE